MPLLLSRRDAALSARACRSLAAILQRDAERQPVAAVREVTLQQVQALERLEQMFEAHAAGAPKRQG